MDTLMRRVTKAVASVTFLFGSSCAVVSSVELVLASPPCPSGFCGALLNKPATFTVRGRGMCSRFSVNFGDGTSTPIDNMDFGLTGANIAAVQHTYTGWSGLKTVTATGVTNCSGTTTQRVRVMHEKPTLHSGEKIGYMATSASACSSLTTLPPLRKNTTVKVSSPISGSNNPNLVISFCALGGCAFDADGIPNSVATGNLPFPGLRQLSMVLRVGTQSVQGGTDATFITTQSGPLDVCVNDDTLWDNTGAWRVDLQVDESQAP
jgi:hypothetical protein